MLSTNQSQSEILSARQGESTSAESKRKSENIVPVYKSENIVPVYIKDIHDCTDEGFTIEGIKVGMIVIVGQVNKITRSSNKTSFIVDDQSGSIDGVYYSEVDSMQKGTIVKVFGILRISEDSTKKHILAFNIQIVTIQAVIDAHFLQIVHSRLKIKELQILLNMDQLFSKFNNGLVYGCIKKKTGELGMDKEQLFQQIKIKMSNSEMETSLKFLSDEGQIYFTIDENHFKTIEGE